VPFHLGEVLFADRSPEEAARYYRISAEIEPSWGDPHYKLGLIYLSQEKYDLTRVSFQKLIELEPNSPLANKARGLLKDFDKFKKAALPVDFAPLPCYSSPRSPAMTLRRERRSDGIQK
jgi:tetratricopeptide (TPR) repeat protein